ncbi:hypothetical protein QJQ45_017455 [Haematococcus lacustris]|nr:hypothetical protein QJQ45_017455 [Haematococcus lacustris]
MLTVYDIVKQAVVLILGIVLAVGFGPIALPLPGLPHVKIVDLKEALRAPEPLPLEGVLEPNNALEAAVVLFNNTLQSSESVLVEPDGSVVLLDKYGALLTAAPNASAPGGYQLDPVPKAWLGPSRPLGFKRDAQGDLIVCNTALVRGSGSSSSRQLWGVAPPRTTAEALLCCCAAVGLWGLQGLVKVVGSSVVLLGQRVSDSSPLDPGSPILYANTLDISPTTGVVYFSDSQMIPVTPNYGVPRARPWYDTLGSYLRGVYSGQATGRVMAYFPNNGSIHVLAKGMWFSNGVALSADESFLLVAETNMFRLLKLWLKGPKAGMLELAVDRLPGFPDGVTRSHDGGFWVALPSPRNQLFQMLQYRSIRTLMAYLPASMRPPLPMWGAVIKVDADGKITRFLADMSGRHVAFIAAVDEQVLENGSIRLWLGNPDGMLLDGSQPDGTQPDGTQPDGTQPGGSRGDRDHDLLTIVAAHTVASELFKRRDNFKPFWDLVQQECIARDSSFALSPPQCKDKYKYAKKGVSSVLAYHKGTGVGSFWDLTKADQKKIVGSGKIPSQELYNAVKRSTDKTINPDATLSLGGAKEMRLHGEEVEKVDLSVDKETEEEAMQAKLKLSLLRSLPMGTLLTYPEQTDLLKMRLKDLMADLNAARAEVKTATDALG